MKSHELVQLMDSFSGGSEGRYRHAFNRRFIYTEGVKAVAEEVGAYWLLDIVATECAPLTMTAYHETYNPSCLLEFEVTADRAELTLTSCDEGPPLWTKSIDFTTFPKGSWVFRLAMDSLTDNGQLAVVMCLLQED